MFDSVYCAELTGGRRHGVYALKLQWQLKRLIKHFFFTNRWQSHTGLNAKVKQGDPEETLQDVIRLCQQQAGPVSED